MNNDFLKQHKDNYKNTVKNIILNNTNALVDEDIISLLKKPPLDSMDLIRSKLLSLAKKNKVVLNTDFLKDILNDYRKELLICSNSIKEIRNNSLYLIVDKHELVKDTDLIKINKKDFNEINKKIKSIIKNSFSASFKLLFDNIDNIFSKDVDISIKSKIIDDFSKFIRNKYQKQVLENIDIKILIKDTTLLNIIKEQGERYVFAINNSRLLNNK